MLCYTHGPEYDNILRLVNRLCNLYEVRSVYSRDLLCIFQCEHLEAFSVFIKAACPLSNEVLILPSLVNDVLCDRTEPYKVCARMWMDE